MYVQCYYHLQKHCKGQLVVGSNTTNENKLSQYISIRASKKIKTYVKVKYTAYIFQIIFL